MAGGRHGKKEIREAIRHAEQHGWTIEQTISGHRWGVARCSEGCEISIWSTPKNAGNHAKRIRRAVDRCPHQEDPNA